MSEKFFLNQFRVNQAECSKVVIVGPYPTKQFVKKVKNELKPQEIFVVVDESWNPYEVEQIKNIVENKRVKMVRTKTGQGIVHSKMYYVQYKRSDGSSSTRLFMGSVNASINSINNNSEFIDCFKLSSFNEKSQKKIKTYFNKLISGQEVNEFKANLETVSEQKKIVLGSLCFPQIVPSGEQKSFYNWIRSGKFFVKYEPDQNFGCLSISLKQENLTQNDFDKKLKGTIFENGRLKSTLRYPYAGKNDENENKRWKKFTVETCYGLWASYECAKEKNLPYKIKGRDEIIKSISELTESEIDSIVNEFVDGIRDLKKKYRVFADCIPEPNSKKLKQKILNDISLAKDTEFVKRFTTGYSSIKHSFNNSSKLESISKDFVNSCLMKQNKIRIDNLMAKKFKELFEDQEIENIRKEVLNHWDKYSRELTNYYKE